MNILNVFSWNYLDAFLMIISVALTQKFRQVTTRVMWAYKTKVSFKKSINASIHSNYLNFLYYFFCILSEM